MNNDGRKPIQCLDVEDDSPDPQMLDEESKEDKLSEGKLLKMQKVNETKPEE